MARKKKMTVADAADKITKRLGQLDKAPGTTYDKNAVAAEKEILEKKLQQLQAYNEQKRMEEERMTMMNSMYSNPMMANGGFVGDGDPPYDFTKTPEENKKIQEDSTKQKKEDIDWNKATARFPFIEKPKRDMPSVKQAPYADYVEGSGKPTGKPSYEDSLLLHNISKKRIKDQLLYENDPSYFRTSNIHNSAIDDSWKEGDVKFSDFGIYPYTPDSSEIIKRMDKSYGSARHQNKHRNWPFTGYHYRPLRDAQDRIVLETGIMPYAKAFPQGEGMNEDVVKTHQKGIELFKKPTGKPPARTRAMGGYTKKRYQLGGPPTFDKWKSENMADWYIKQTDPTQLQQEYNDWLSANYITPEGGDVTGYSENLTDRMDYTGNLPVEYQEFTTNTRTGAKAVPKEGFEEPKTGYFDEEGEFVEKAPNDDIYKVDKPQGTKEEREWAENSGLPGSEYHPIEGGQGFDWGEAGYQAARFAPVAYNLFQGLRKQEPVEPFYNPYESQALNLLKGREYNIQPQIEAAKRADALKRKNILSASGGNAATYLGNIGASGRQYLGDVSSLYGQKQNIENQWEGQLAGAYGNFGAQRAEADRYAEDINARNEAMRRKYLGTAATQGSQIVQSDRLMRNLSERDKALIPFLREIYYGYNPQSETGTDFLG